MLRSHALEKGRALTWEVEAAPSLSRMAPAPALAAKASAVEEERLGLHGRFETLPVWNIEGLARSSTSNRPAEIRALA